MPRLQGAAPGENGQQPAPWRGAPPLSSTSPCSPSSQGRPPTRIDRVNPAPDGTAQTRNSAKGLRHWLPEAAGVQFCVVPPRAGSRAPGPGWQMGFIGQRVPGGSSAGRARQQLYFRLSSTAHRLTEVAHTTAPLAAAYPTSHPISPANGPAPRTSTHPRGGRD